MVIVGLSHFHVFLKISAHAQKSLQWFRIFCGNVMTKLKRPHLVKTRFWYHQKERATLTACKGSPNFKKMLSMLSKIYRYIYWIKYVFCSLSLTSVYSFILIIIKFELIRVGKKMFTDRFFSSYDHKYILSGKYSLSQKNAGN